MIERPELPVESHAAPVSDGSLKASDFAAVCLIFLMTLGPLTATADQNPYTKAITAMPHLPQAR